MRCEGREGAPVAARGSFSVEWLRPVPATARPTELRLSHLIPLNPGKSRIRINVWPSGTAEPNRNRGEKSGPVPRFRSSYAFDPVRVLFDLSPSLRHARTCSGHLHRPGATEGRGWPGQARPRRGGDTLRMRRIFSNGTPTALPKRPYCRHHCRLAGPPPDGNQCEGLTHGRCQAHDAGRVPALRPCDHRADRPLHGRGRALPGAQPSGARIGPRAPAGGCARAGRALRGPSARC